MFDVSTEPLTSRSTDGDDRAPHCVGRVERLLIVDDDPKVAGALYRILHQKGRRIRVCENGNDALDAVDREDFGVVLSDRMMPGIDGVTLLERIRYRRPETTRILITGYSDEKSAIAAVNRCWAFAYVTKPWKNKVLRDTLNRAFRHHEAMRPNQPWLAAASSAPGELEQINRNLSRIQQNTLKQLQLAEQEAVVMLAQAAEAKDDDTGEHVHRVRRLVERICAAMGLYGQTADQISRFSCIHDVGKIHVPDRILKKPGPLSAEEWEVMKQHTVYGEMILGKLPCYRIAREITRSHHEKWDGSGYPDGLSGAAIPLPARIMAVADVFDALTHERPYKAAWPVDRAVVEIRSQSGKAFDPKVVEAFLAVIRDDSDPKGALN